MHCLPKAVRCGSSKFQGNNGSYVMRVTLGRPSVADTLAISVAMMDPRISSWLNSFPYDGFKSLDAPLNSATLGEYAILVEGRFAGLFLAAPELGCWVDRKYRRQGVATRAAVLALSRYFAQGGGFSQARSLPENEAMRFFLKVLGFRESADASRLEHPPAVILHRLTRDDFAQAQPFALTTARTTVSLIQPKDYALIYDIAMRRDVLNGHSLAAPAMTKAAFTARFTPFRASLPVHALIQIQGRTVGYIGINDDPLPKVDLLLLPEVWGLGIASEVLPAFCAEIFERYLPTEIYAEVRTDNLAACKVMERSGFKPDLCMTDMLSQNAILRFRCKRPFSQI